MARSGLKESRGTKANSDAPGKGGDEPGGSRLCHASLPQHSYGRATMTMKRTIWWWSSDGEETRVALRFAARRAGRPAADRSAGDRRAAGIRPVGGVQAAIEEEQRLRSRQRRAANVGGIIGFCRDQARNTSSARASPSMWCRRMSGDAGGDIAALVLGATLVGPSSRGGGRGISPAMTQGELPCPVMIIPGSLTDEQLEQLSSDVPKRGSRPARRNPLHLYRAYQDRRVSGLSRSSTAEQHAIAHDRHRRQLAVGCEVASNKDLGKHERHRRALDLQGPRRRGAHALAERNANTARAALER